MTNARMTSAQTNDVPLLLVDGHNLLWRAWFSFPARIWSRDKTRDVTGVFGFFALLRVAISELPVAPEIVVVFDGENAWADRVAVDPSYKAHRPTHDEAMAPIKSLADIERGLDAVGVHRVCVDTAEADDVIATLAARSRKRWRGRDVVIMSIDRDFYQLLDSRTRILNTARRPGFRMIEQKEIEARFGVTPSQWCDRASLVGDPSDGIRGIHGVGPITAARLLADGLTVEQLPTSGRCVGRIGGRVLDGFKDVVRWKSMVRLRTDAPLPRGVLTGRPSPELPAAPQVLEAINYW